MLIKNIALAALIITATGCANTEALEASVSSLNQKVDTLTNKVNALTDEVGELKTQQESNSESIESVKSAADRTNEWITSFLAIKNNTNIHHKTL